MLGTFKPPNGWRIGGKIRQMNGRPHDVHGEYGLFSHPILSSILSYGFETFASSNNAHRFNNNNSNKKGANDENGLFGVYLTAP